MTIPLLRIPPPSRGIFSTSLKLLPCIFKIHSRRLSSVKVLPRAIPVQLKYDYFPAAKGEGVLHPHNSPQHRRPTHMREQSTPMHTLEESSINDKENIRRSTPLVIVHGLFGAKVNWRSIARRFARDLERDVYTVDLRNHGNSPHKPTHSYGAMVADLNAFLHHLKIKKACFLGHSMGGKAVMSLALSSPSTIDRIVVEDAAPVKYEHLVELEEYLAAMQEIDLSSITNRKDAHKKLKFKLKGCDESVITFLSSNLIRTDGGSYKWRCNLDNISLHLKDIFDFPPFTEPFIGPALFLKATKAEAIRYSDMSRLEKLFPNMQLVEMETGHWVHVDDVDGFVHNVHSFLCEPTSSNNQYDTVVDGFGNCGDLDGLL
eukprot:CFRG0303T1